MKSAKTLFSVLAVAAALACTAALAAGSVRQLLVEGMTCSSCARSVKAALLKLPEVRAVEVDVEKGTVTLELQPEKSVSEKQVRDAVKAAGYKVTRITPAKSS